MPEDMIRDPYVLKFLGLNPNDDFNELELETIKNKDMHILAKGFSKTAKHYGLELCTCSELIELHEYEICHAHCIDYKLLECLGNCLLIAGKDKTKEKSVDVLQVWI